MKDSITINVIRDFNKKPYGRYVDPDGDGCGTLFRQNILVPMLKEYQHVHVDLDGYNRYGRSFLDESFGGLIREEKYTWEELSRRLTYSHSLVKSIELLIAERLEAARKDCE